MVQYRDIESIYGRRLQVTVNPVPIISLTCCVSLYDTWDRIFRTIATWLYTNRAFHRFESKLEVSQRVNPRGLFR